MLNWFKKRRRAKIRAYMRGYNALVKENKPEYIAQLRNELANNPINGLSVKANFNSNKNTCYHQFLVYRVINWDLNKALLTAIVDPKNRVYHPLPNQWRKILVDNGFKVPVLWNKILWIQFNIKWFFVGLAVGLLEILKANTKQNKNLLNLGAFFENLSPNNLTQSPDNNAKNIVEWFSEQKEANTVESIHHSCKASASFKVNGKNVSFRPHALPGINSSFKLLKFSIWLVKKSCIALFNQRERLLFRQLVFQKIAQLTTPNERYKMYLFHNSGHIFRPLWTYVVEQKGSQIIFYFYSINNSSFKVKSKTKTQDGQWQVLNWPNYWVWNKEQEVFLKSYIQSDYTTTIKNVIPFSCSNKEIDISQLKVKPILLIFDVQPVNKIFYTSLAQSVDFYSEENTINFLEWIDQLANAHGINIIIKRKRKNELVSEKYIRKVNKLKENGLWNEIDPSIDANSALVNLNPIASISIPFTSTAYISKAHKIPAIYLDPTGKLDKEFYANIEVPLLSCKVELFKWFENIYAKQVYMSKKSNYN